MSDPEMGDVARIVREFIFEELVVRVTDPHFWLHPACVPIDQVDFTAQQSMFADRGCTTGCFT